MDNKDQFYMQETLKLAKLSSDKDEVPVGAMIVIDDAVISTSMNNREVSQSPMAHAEFHAIEEASRKLSRWRLENATLYVSMEPCLMCTGLIYAARIPRVVFGCKNPKGGSLLYIEERRKELNLNHSVKIVSGIMESETAQVLKDFFKNKRL